MRYLLVLLINKSVCRLHLHKKKWEGRVQARIGMQAGTVQLYTLEEKRRLNEGDYLAKLHDNSLLSNLLEAFAVLERRFNLWDRDEAGMLLFTAVPLP